MLLKLKALYPLKRILVSAKRKNRDLRPRKRGRRKSKRIESDEQERTDGLVLKRLKIQPVLKPKAVTYCRQYLMGRCREGEKCNFHMIQYP